MRVQCINCKRWYEDTIQSPVCAHEIVITEKPGDESYSDSYPDGYSEGRVV